MGHVLHNNGSLSLTQMYEYLMNIFVTHNGFEDREIKIASGQGGILYFSQLLAEEAKLYSTVDTHFIRTANNMQKFARHQLEFGKFVRRAA